jgi:replicative DNA helicase
MRGGDMVAYIARPGGGKSTMMMRQSLQEARMIASETPPGENCKEVVVAVTYEQCQEELENFIQTNDAFSATDVAWGRVPLDKIVEQVRTRARLPLWIVGHSAARAGTKKPTMTPDVILDAIKWIVDEQNVKIRLMTFDYIQLIPSSNPHLKRTEQLLEVVPTIKQLALEIGAPALIAVQASREVDALKFKTPELNHAQFGSVIEQACDKVFSFWRPWQTESEDSLIDLGPKYGGEQPVTPNMLIVSMLKQRFGVGRALWPMYFDPAYLKLVALELRHAQQGGLYGL